MRFSRTNMRLAAARCRSLSRKIGVQTAEFSITAFCWRNADSRKSRTYERHNAEIRLELFNLSQAAEKKLEEADKASHFAHGEAWSGLITDLNAFWSGLGKGFATAAKQWDPDVPPSPFVAFVKAVQSHFPEKFRKHTH